MTAATIYLERIGWEEAAIWAVVLIVMTLVLRPKPAVTMPDWIPLMVGIGVLDIALLIRSGLESVRGGMRPF